MRQQPSRTSAGMHVGSATLVMLFSVLCLTIFAVLSVVTANSSWTLAEKSAAAVTAYYQADYTATEILDQVTASYDGAFVLPTHVTAQLEQVDGVDGLSYWVPIDDNQALWVQLTALRGEVRVTRWEVEVTGTWNADQTLHLWGG